MRRDPLRREPRRRLPQQLEPVGERRQVPQADALLLEEDLQQGEQEERIAPGADGQMLVRRRGSLGAARVDHHQLAAAFAQVVEPARDATRRHQTPVRGEGIRAQHEEEAGPIDVGDRQQHLMAEHLQGGEHVRELVDRGRRKARPRPQRPVEERRRQQRGVRVHGGIAQVHPDGAPAVLALHFGETRPCLVERRLPGDRLPPAAFVSFVGSSTRNVMIPPSALGPLAVRNRRRRRWRLSRLWFCRPSRVE